MKSYETYSSFQNFQGDTQYVAECIDAPIVTQGKTVDEVLANIKKTLQLHFEERSLPEKESPMNQKQYFDTNSLVRQYIGFSKKSLLAIVSTILVGAVFFAAAPASVNHLIVKPVFAQIVRQSLSFQ